MVALKHMQPKRLVTSCSSWYCLQRTACLSYSLLRSKASSFPLVTSVRLLSPKETLPTITAQTIPTSWYLPLMRPNIFFSILRVNLLLCLACIHSLAQVRNCTGSEYCNLFSPSTIQTFFIDMIAKQYVPDAILYYLQTPEHIACVLLSQAEPWTLLISTRKHLHCWCASSYHQIDFSTLHHLWVQNVWELPRFWWWRSQEDGSCGVWLRPTDIMQWGLRCPRVSFEHLDWPQEFYVPQSCQECLWR